MADSSQLFKDDEQERLGNDYVPDDDELRHITGINPEQEEAHDREAQSGAAEDIGARENEAAGDAPKKDKSKEEKTASPTDLAGAEGAAGLGAEALGKGFTAAAGGGALGSRIVTGFLNRRRQAAVGGGIGGAVVTVLIIAFAGLIPLKIENMVKNLQQHFFATTQNATQKETQKMLETYVRKYVFGGLSKCSGTTIDRNCRALPVSGTDPVSNLFRSWRDARIENKLATGDHPIEFKKVGSHYYIRGTGTDFINVDEFAEGRTDLFDSDGFRHADNKKDFRRIVKNELNLKLEGTTFWKRTQVKLQVQAVLKSKHHIKFCVFACSTKADDIKQSLNDWKLQKKQAALIKLLTRVNEPRAKAIDGLLQCVMDRSCVATAEDPTTSSAPGTNGEPSTKSADDISKAMEDSLRAAGSSTAEVAEVFGVSADKLGEEAAKIQKDGVQKYLAKDFVNSILEKSPALGAKVSADTTVEVASKAIPIIGWIDLASTVVSAVDHGSTMLQHAPYLLNSAAMVQTATMFNSYADEMKTGNVDAALVGSMTDVLSADSSADQGGQAAEASPIYKEIIEGNDNPSTTGIKCNDGNPVPAGSTLCPEMSLKYDNVALDAIRAYFNTPSGQLLSTFAGLWEHTVGAVFNFLGNVVATVGANQFKDLNNACDDLDKGIGEVGPISYGESFAKIHGLDAIPGGLAMGTNYCYFKKETAAIIPPLMEAVTKSFFPSPVTPHMSGSRAVENVAGGDDVMAKDFAEDSQGGRVLSDTEVAANFNEQTSYNNATFASAPLTTKLFSTGTSYSLVSRLALDIPISSASGAIHGGVMALLQNPFSLLTSSFSSLLSPAKAFAADQAKPDPFGLARVGYPVDDPIFNADPQAYWTDHDCGNPDQVTQWRQQHSNEDGDPTETNPCLLIRSTIGAAGGVFDTKNLTDDEQASLNEDNGSGDSSGTTGDVPTGPTASSQQVLNSCKDGTASGKVKIVCSSLTLKGISYGDPGGSTADFLNHNPPIVGCNAFVNISIARATNGAYSENYCSQEFVNGKEFKKIDLHAVQPGDIVVRESSCGCTSSAACGSDGKDNQGRYGHVAVVVSYDPGDDKIVVSEASSPSHPSGVSDASTATWSASNVYGFTYGLQYTGGGL